MKEGKNVRHVADTRLIISLFLALLLALLLEQMAQAAQPNPGPGAEAGSQRCCLDGDL